MLISIVIAQSHTNIFISSNTICAVVELKMSLPACRTSSYRFKNQLYKLIRVKDLDQFANVGIGGNAVPIMTCKIANWESGLSSFFGVARVYSHINGFLEDTQRDRESLLLAYSPNLFAFWLLRFCWIYIYSDSLEEKIILRYCVYFSLFATTRLK